MNQDNLEKIIRLRHELHMCPGAIFYIGSGENHSPLHTASFDFNDNILGTAVDLFTALVLQGFYS